MNERSINIFVIVSDLMTVTLFIFIIALITYMLNFDQQHRQEEQLNANLRDHLALKSDLLNNISKDLRRYTISHTTNFKSGVLRFTEADLQFLPGHSDLSDRQRETIKSVRIVFEKHLNCYTRNPSQRRHCRKGQRGQLKRVVIEGHTDNIPIHSERFEDNIELSVKRAKSVYNHLLIDSNLGKLINKHYEKLFVVAGYGSVSPLQIHKYPTSDAENRRIDIRFQLYDPWTTN